MKISTAFKIAPTALALVCGFSASAEIIMYNGFPRSVDATYFKGFTTNNPSSTMQPYGVSYMMKNEPKSSTLSFPACFDGKVQRLRGGEDDAALFVAGTNYYKGAASGAKVLKLSDNCQSRTGSLHFRVLMKADQGALDAMTSSSTMLTVDNSQACGLLWTVPDYFTGAVTNSSLRLNKGLTVSKENNVANTGIYLNFVRGLLFSYCKDASGTVSLRLFVCGSEATALSEAKSITLVDSVTAGETYVCYAKIDIDAAGTLDIIRGMAQTVTGYDSAAAWPGSPFPSAITANLIGGEDVAGLNANFVAFGANKQKDTVAIDEVCLATTADEAVVFDAANTDMGVVIAYDGFPCGDGAYSETEVAVNSMSALSTSAIYGFSGSKWQYNISKSTPVLFGAGNGLALPSIYADQGISATAGTSVGWKPSGSPSQSLMVYRTLTDGLMNLSAGAKLNMRFLMSVTKNALSSLATGSDAAGTLTEGTAGVQANVNYVGAGLVSLPETAIEFNNSQAPALSPRDNSCLFAFVKGSDGKVGLYLNLRTTASGAQTSYKLTDVDATTGGTYLCFVTIEVGTGTDGKEKIRAFGVNVNDVTEQRIAKWAPQNASKTSAIECELIGASSYPKHLAVGGSACSSSFKFDEFALSLGDWYPLVWAKYPRMGLSLIFR